MIRNRFTQLLDTLEERVGSSGILLLIEFRVFYQLS